MALDFWYSWCMATA